MWFITSFMKRLANQAFKYKISILKICDQYKMPEGILMSYCTLVAYFLRTNETDDIIAEADAKIRKFYQLENQIAEQFQRALWRKSSR